MKRKHQGLMAVILLLSVVAVSALYFFYGDGSETKHRTERLRMSYDQMAAPDRKELLFIRKILEKDLAGLVFPGGPDKTSLNLLLFGHLNEERALRENAIFETNTQALTPRFSYAVSFIFSLGAKRFCLIDGHFYPEGASLPDGAIIEKVGENGVYVRKNSVGEWVPINPKDEKKEAIKEGSEKMGTKKTNKRLKEVNS